MAIKTRRKKNSGSSVNVKTEGTGNAISGAVNTQVSRRTMLKGTVTAAAVVGASVTMKGMKLPRLQQSSSSTTTTTTAVTTTAPPQTPIVATTPMGQRTITLNVNGTNYNVNVYPRTMLVDVLRESMNLIATKRPCNRNECGACTVLIDGKAYESCNFMAIRAAGHTILTGEGGASDPVVSALQQAWVTADGGQCTFCGPGMINAAAALLKQNPNPAISDIKAGLSGNLCRCGNYTHIINAVQLAATNLGGA